MRMVGLIATPKQAETIMADGKADMVARACPCHARRPPLGLALGSSARCRGRPHECCNFTIASPSNNRAEVAHHLYLLRSGSREEKSI
jgi:hypothetical protein